MLKIWRKSRFDIALRNAFQKSVILAGISVGAMCWFETCCSEKNDEEYEELKGLGMLKGSLCPHYNDEENHRNGSGVLLIIFNKIILENISRT